MPSSPLRLCLVPLLILQFVLPSVLDLSWILLLFLSLRVVLSSRHVSSERALACPLVFHVESLRREISLGKHPVEEVPDAAVGGNFLFCLAFSFSCLHCIYSVENGEAGSSNVTWDRLKLAV